MVALSSPSTKSQERDVPPAQSRKLRGLVDRVVSTDRDGRRLRPVATRIERHRIPDRRLSSAWRRVIRTDSIDYAIVLSGESDMEIDGALVHLRGGDVLVQRGTIHNWTNPGTEPCVVAFVLVAAKPVERAGKVLNATG
jgi:hypothetical protein